MFSFLSLLARLPVWYVRLFQFVSRRRCWTYRFQFHYGIDQKPRRVSSCVIVARGDSAGRELLDLGEQSIPPAAITPSTPRSTSWQRVLFLNLRFKAYVNSGVQKRNHAIARCTVVFRCRFRSNCYGSHSHSVSRFHTATTMIEAGPAQLFPLCPKVTQSRLRTASLCSMSVAANSQGSHAAIAIKNGELV